MKINNFLCSNMLIAHRGLYNDEKGIIENTIPAFEKAIRYNYIIELDVHIISDNTIVVFHDDNIERLTGIDRKIREYNYNELKKIRLNNTNSYIPQLEEVLRLVNGRVPILIELKYDRFIGKLEKELIKILAKYKGDYAIQSFNPLSVIWFRMRNTDILRGQITSSFIDKKMWLNFLSKPHFISFNIHHTRYKTIKKIKKKYAVLGWTVKTKEEYIKFNKYYDNLICEYFLYPTD